MTKADHVQEILDIPSKVPCAGCGKLVDYNRQHCLCKECLRSAMRQNVSYEMDRSND